MKNRKVGFYWVRYNKKWCVAYFQGKYYDSLWFSSSWVGEKTDIDFEKIDENKIIRNGR